MSYIDQEIICHAILLNRENTYYKSIYADNYSVYVISLGAVIYFKKHNLLIYMQRHH
jgi:hypothetical protein